MNRYIIKYYKKSTQTFHWIENLCKTSAAQKVSALIDNGTLMKDIEVFKVERVNLSIGMDK